MGEAEKAQGGSGRPVNDSEHKKPDLTTEEQDFLRMLCRVLPKLVSGFEMAAGDPSPLSKSTASPDKKGEKWLAHRSSMSQPSFTEIQEEEDQEEQRLKALRQYFMNRRGLYSIVEKFKKIENRVRTVEGGTQLIDALVELEEVAGKSEIAVDIREMLNSFRSASDVLIEAFKRLGEDLFREKHLAPLHELKLLCWGKLRDTRRRSMTDEEKTEIILSLSKHIVHVTQGLSEVFESAIPVFLETREKAQSIDYNNMLTAATFFSAVTATTLQLSYAYNTNPHASFGVAVNTLWFVALVFSTASSLNSIVGLTWYQKIRRNQLLPDWARLWVEDGPIISLAIASASFSVGLCLFAFSSSQHTITSALTATFTAAHAVALFAPLCIYSPNKRRATRAFIVFHALLLLIPYLFIAYIKSFITCIKRKAHEHSFKKASEVETERDVSSSSTRGAGPNSSPTPIGIKENTKMSLILVRLSAHSVVAWLITCLLTLYLHRIYATEESDNIARAHEPNERVVLLSRLEFDIESQSDLGKPCIQKPTVTEDQDIVLSEWPRILTPDVIDPDEDAGHTAKGSGKEVVRGSVTRPTLESTKGSTAAASSTADPAPGLGSSPTVPNPDNSFENDMGQETDTPGRPNASQEEEPRHPFNPSAQESIEADNINAPNPTFKVGRKRRVAFEEGSPSTNNGNTGNLE